MTTGTFQAQLISDKNTRAPGPPHKDPCVCVCVCAQALSVVKLEEDIISPELSSEHGAQQWSDMVQVRQRAQRCSDRH